MQKSRPNAHFPCHHPESTNRVARCRLSIYTPTSVRKFFFLHGLQFSPLPQQDIIVVIRCRSPPIHHAPAR